MLSTIPRSRAPHCAPRAGTLLRLLLLVLVATCMCWLVLLLPVVDAARKPPIDYDSLEKAWEAGDADQELRSSGDEQFQTLSEK